ncbi:MAG: PIN domain-containing protein [Pseudanabaena sp. ELA607]|jgi:predicted nucleic acid-binding protein
MKTVFADTSYWIAFLNEDDDLYEIAIQTTEKLFPMQIVTSEMILSELLNHVSKKGKNFRNAAVNFINQLNEEPNVVITPQTSPLFTIAFQLYAQRQDKAWSHTDCSSFCIMEELGITEALTYDKHFEQAGFVALLRS